LLMFFLCKGQNTVLHMHTQQASSTYSISSHANGHLWSFPEWCYNTEFQIWFGFNDFN